MTIYILTLILLFVFSLLSENFNLSSNMKNWMLYVVYIVFVVQVGLRWETGTDWEPYLSHFNNTDNIYYIFLSQFEIGYNFVVWFFKLFSTNYSVFLFLHAIVFYYLIFKSFEQLTDNVFVSLMLYYSLTLGMLGSNRQLIALAICLYALKYLLNGKRVTFIFLILLALLFHTSAFFFFIYLFLNRRISIKIAFVLLFVSIVIGNTEIPIQLISKFSSIIGGNVLEKTTAYTEFGGNSMSEVKLTVFGLLKRIILLFLFFLKRDFLMQKLKYYNILLNGYFIGILIYFLFSNSLLIMVNRGGLYFNSMEPLLLASQLLLLKGKDTRTIGIILLFVLSFIFIYQSIAAYSDLFIPYKGIFINTNYYREMY